ncbi:MAG: response regulator [Desulfobacterales bacterium]|nr:response regulator [Desulfobacterales bacterium]
MSAFEETRGRWYLQHGFRHHLLVLQSLIFALLLAVILYIFQRNGVALEASQLLLVAMVLLLVLAGMMRLCQLFDRFFGLAVLVEETGMSQKKGDAGQPDAGEPRQISFSFNRLMQRFEMDLNFLVGDIAETLSSTCKNIRFQKRLAAHLPAVVADPGQMTQVMMNVMLNATEAMAKGGDLVIETARVTPADAPSDGFQTVHETDVRLMVTDTGTGMDSASEADPREAAARGEATVLMVDDEEIVLEVGAMMLRSLGYRVFEASNGRQALEIMRREQDHIDLVVLDMIMPEMSGEAVFERLRAVKPGVRILLSSGYAREGQADQLLARGCDGFLQKPFGRAELGKAISEIIDVAEG